MATLVYRDQQLGNSDGVATCLISHNKSGIVWEVQQITGFVPGIELTSQMGVYHNQDPVAPSAALATITGPNGSLINCQTYGGEPYLYLYASDTIQVVCSGLSQATSQLTIRAQYREMLESTFEAIGGR